MLRLLIGCGVLVGAVTGAVTALLAAQPAPNCQFYKVSVPSLNVSPEPRGDATYIDVLDGGDVACVTIVQKTDRNWSYVAYVLKGSERRAIGGWANQNGLQRMSEAEVGALPGGAGASAEAPKASTAPPLPLPPSDQAAAAPPAVATAPPSASDSSEEPVKWSAPLASGPYPVVGQTLEQLAHRTPVFGPLEGLDEKFWKKDCGQCHQWSRDQLCGQGKLYVGDPGKILRIKHPYGGAFKLALWRWAKTGCQ